MGTAFRVSGRSLKPEHEVDAIVEAAWQILRQADEIFSLYKPGSALSKLYRGEASMDELPEVVSTIWDECVHWEKITDGYFSAFTPENTFDPSGLVKTWAAQRAAAEISDRGLTDFSLNAGGDIFIAPGCSSQLDWKVGVHKPTSIADEAAGVLTVLDLIDTGYNSVATSGYAERGLHIWNPKAAGKKPNQELAQVTVVSDDLVGADVWATAAMAAGNRALPLLEQQPNLEALLIRSDGTMQATSGFGVLFAR